VEVSAIYLIRHGQAGPRHRYDELSELGRAQAASLGRHFAAQGMAFTALYAGGLQRQQETAEIVRAALEQAKGSAPEIVIDDGWNEFNLSSVYRAIADHLSRDLPGFAEDFAEMQAALIADPNTVRGAAGRCDRVVIQAWIEHRYPHEEIASWIEFRQRVEAQRDLFSRHDDEERIAIFTSATPIAITIGAALGLSNEKILGLMGALYNTSVSELRLRDGESWLLTFNGTPHLDDPAMRTFR
jgi:broad specificity phosphatase PhoE